MQRFATAVWHGSIQEGQGEISTASGALKQTPYSFATRFGDIAGTNPEELIAAAHSACFAMATAAGLSAKGLEPQSLEVKATVSLQKDGASWKVASSHLELKGQVTGTTQGQFVEIAEDAKKNCPISKLLNADITLEAYLEEGPELTKPWAAPPAH